MRLKCDTLIAALTFVRLGQELGSGGRLATLVAEAINAVIELLGGAG